LYGIGHIDTFLLVIFGSIATAMEDNTHKAKLMEQSISLDIYKIQSHKAQGTTHITWSE